MFVAADNPGALEAVAACPACGGGTRTRRFETQDWLHGRPGAFQVVQCGACTLLYLAARPNGDAIAAYYPADDYYAYKAPAPYDLFHRSSAAARAWYAIRRSVLAHRYGYEHLGGRRWIARAASLPGLGMLHDAATFRLSVLLHPFVPGGRLLEVGCGSGMYLGLMRALGWQQAVGVDIGAESIRLAREVMGLDARRGRLEDMEFGDAQFDAVTLSHTLEHVPDPFAFLREVERVLKPGARLAIVTPNAASDLARRHGRYWFHLDSPRHTVVFSPDSLCRLLTRAGFQVVSVATTARMAYHTALVSGRRGRSSGDTSGDHHRGISAPGRVAAAAQAVRERIRCAFGVQAGEELLAVAVKP